MNFPEEPFVISEAASVVVISLCLQVLCRSKNRILKECFLVAELENRRRAPTVSVCVVGGEGAVQNWKGSRNHSICTNMQSLNCIL